MNRLVFTEEGHSYALDGKPIPSVTSILKKVGATSAFYSGDGSAMDRGTRVHEATEMMDALGMRPADFPADIRDRLEDWEMFKNALNTHILRIEQKVYSEKYWYCGTLDRLVEINGMPFILDIKTGQKAKWHPFQLAAYALAFEEIEHGIVNSGIIVRLTPAGYKIDAWSDFDTDMEPFAPYKAEWLRLLQNYKELQNE